MGITRGDVMQFWATETNTMTLLGKGNDGRLTLNYHITKFPIQCKMNRGLPTQHKEMSILLSYIVGPSMFGERNYFHGNLEM